MVKYLNMSLALLIMDIVYDIMCYAIYISLSMFVFKKGLQSVLRGIVCTSAQAMGCPILPTGKPDFLLTFRFFLYVLLKLGTLIIL